MTSNSIIYLSAPGGFVPFPGALEGRPREVAGQPCSYFWKDLIGIDDYENAARKFVMSVPPDRLQKWERTGNEMLAAGINIPIVEDHKETAEASRGRVVEFKIKNAEPGEPRLYGLCQLIGEDAPLLAARNQVSVGVPVGDYITGGKNWGDAIRHVALTPVPAVHDQQPFVQAASQSAADAGAILTLAASSTHRSDPMKTLKCSEECMSALHDIVPGLKDIPDDEKMAHVNSHLQTLHAASKEDAGYDDDGGADDVQSGKVAKMSAAEIVETAGKKRDGWRTRLAQARKDIAGNQSKIAELSTAVATATEAVKPKTLDGRTAFLLSQAINTERQAAIDAGGVDAETVKRLDALLVKNGKPTVLALSQESDESPLLAMEVWGALKANKPDTSKIIKTGIQNMSNAVTMNSVAGAQNEAEKQALERMQKVANGQAA